jgi:hypothetical protein
MARIAGLKFIKSASGKITHVTLSMKHHAKILEDMIDAAEMEEERKGESIPWEVARKKLNKKFKFKD